MAGEVGEEEEEVVVGVWFGARALVLGDPGVWACGTAQGGRSQTNVILWKNDESVAVSSLFHQDGGAEEVVQ